MSLTKVIKDGLQSSEMVDESKYNLIWTTDMVKNVRGKKIKTAKPLEIQKIVFNESCQGWSPKIRNGGPDQEQLDLDHRHGQERTWMKIKMAKP